MKNQHTPGPWEIESRSQTEMIFGPKVEPVKSIDAFTGQSLTASDRPLIARVCNGPLSPEGKANARLIAAAPEMLALLKFLLTDTETDDDVLIRMIEDMINKAEPKEARPQGCFYCGSLLHVEEKCSKGVRS